MNIFSIVFKIQRLTEISLQEARVCNLFEHAFPEVVVINTRGRDAGLQLRMIVFGPRGVEVRFEVFRDQV
jgi:hypothetical protein